VGSTGKRERESTRKCSGKCGKGEDGVTAGLVRDDGERLGVGC